MTSKKIIYYILAAFIAGNLLLIYLQYNSAKNINGLISGNERLVNEFRVDNELQELEKDIASIDNAVRSTILAGDSSRVEGLEANVSELETDLARLQNINDDDSSVKFIDQLDQLVRAKISFSNTVLDSFHQSGRIAASNLLSDPRGQQLTKQIRNVAYKIDTSRQLLLSSLTESVDRSGRRARTWGTVLIALVLIGGAAMFWFIINRIGRQSQLIHQLDASERKVRESAKVKENFMANMSHEIRTPMNAILGFTHLLQQKQLDDPSREFVSSIQQSGENLLTIINDILDLSKIEAGMMRIESAPFSIRGLLHSVSTLFREKARAKGLAFETSVEDKIPDILNGDATRLTQVLINLISNAVKFTDQGAVSVQISDGGIKGSMLLLRIDISDTGVGIHPDVLPRIFERFRQAEDSITRKYGGTGLGLSIVKDLVGLQRGSIEVDSRPDEGTHFRVNIPYEISTSTLEQISNSGSNIDSTKSLPQLRVLVVEDNEINQRLLQHILNGWQVTFDIAANGKEAIEKLSATFYDVILMDIQMPEMDGYSATAEIRSRLQIDTPIIAMTAHALPGETEKCLRVGMNDYLSKPIRPDELFDRLYSTYIDTSGKKTNSFDADSPYRYINLRYMKEVSGGKQDYERTVTAQFLEIIPRDLVNLEIALQRNDIPRLQRIAHDMKTSLSVMGLNETLQPYLDAIEAGASDPSLLRSNCDQVIRRCQSALREADQFFQSLD